MDDNFEEIVKILSTPLGLRTKKMINILVYHTKHISFFENMIKEQGEKIHYQTCEALLLEYYPSETVSKN